MNWISVLSFEATAICVICVHTLYFLFLSLRHFPMAAPILLIFFVSPLIICTITSAFYRDGIKYFPSRMLFILLVLSPLFFR
jgi:hypothetical protein